jgi:type II secretory pathway component PulF
MIRSSRLAMYAESLALLIEQHVPLTKSLTLVADSTGDGQLQRASQKLAAQIERGGVLQAPVEPEQKLLPPMVRWLLMSHSDSAHLASALRHYAQSEHRRAEYWAQWLRVQLPVLLTIVIGGGATLAYALAVFVPWCGVLRDLSQF